MAIPALKLPSYDDILALPENVIGEIINGRLEVQPRPAPKHALTSSALGGELFRPFQRGGSPGGWWILDEPELHIGNACRNCLRRLGLKSCPIGSAKFYRSQPPKSIAARKCLFMQVWAYSIVG